MSRHVDGTTVVLPFGKHKGETLEDVPPRYLRWLSLQPWFEFKFDGLWRKVTSYLSDPAVQRVLADADQVDDLFDRERPRGGGDE